MQNNSKIIFILAHKYFKGYPSYLKYYIHNIKLFYENSLIIVVDNNSEFKNEIFDTLEDSDDLIFLDNNIESKFEIGAYTVGLKYLLENDLVKNYEFVCMVQDNFVLKNKFDFKILKDKGVTACPLVGLEQSSEAYKGIFGEFELYKETLSKLDLYNNMDKISFCWCSSFVISASKVSQLFSYFSKIIIRTRKESCDGERFLARIIYELNDGGNYHLDSSLFSLNYNCHSVDIYSDTNHFFVKRTQGKNENTINK